MASRVSALVRTFLQTDGDALYLVAGEKIFVTRGTTRAVAGREVVSEELFRGVVDELVPGVPAAVLARKRSRFPYVVGPGVAPVELRFAEVGGAAALMIVRADRAAAAEAGRTPTPAPRLPDVLVAPPSIVEPEPGPPVASGGRTDPADPVEGRGLLGALLLLARERGATDLVFSPGERPLFRVAGTLVPTGAVPPTAADVRGFLDRSAPDVAERSLLRAGCARFAAEVEGAGRCLVRAARDRSGTALSVRLLPSEAPRLEELDLPEPVTRLARVGPGLVLVAGPPGSGRSTLLASLAAHAAQTAAERVVTVEDPVELVIPPGRGSVSQRQVGTDVPSVRAGLKSAALDDAGVVFVGAVPDSATAALLVEVAVSGRLVLAPAPATTLAQALQWLDALLPEGRRVELRTLLASSFRGGVALALCRGTRGGPKPAAEVLDPGSLVSELILSGGLAVLSEELRDSSGYVPLNSSLARLVVSGLVEAREALARSVDRPGLLARLREAGVSLAPDLPAGASGAPGGV
jgi:Tfp pilus assembly pilus retraction ATPase PilT